MELMQTQLAHVLTASLIPIFSVGYVVPALDPEFLQTTQQRQAVGLHSAGVASCKRPDLIGCCLHPYLQSLLGSFHLQASMREEFSFII